MTCERCGKLCTVYNGIFSATSHVSFVYFKNLYEVGMIILLKKTDIAETHDAKFATSRTGHDIILKWNSYEDTAGKCYTLELIQTLYA